METSEFLKIVENKATILRDGDSVLFAISEYEDMPAAHLAEFKAYLDASLPGTEVHVAVGISAVLIKRATL